MTIYPAKKKGFFTYFLFGMMLFVLGIFALDIQAFLSNPLIMLPLLSPVFLLLWVYFDTYYGIEATTFYYRSAFLKGKIDIEKISSITKNATMYVGLKPALAMNGIIITYNRFDKIYIAPESNEGLIEALLAINGNIELKEKQ